ncbi:hypothetical protein KGQ71_02445, partial [Patescibacteria group bacterium]|nr:hypothetical protein [Patescibacteria group bacterium]
IAESGQIKSMEKERGRRIKEITVLIGCLALLAGIAAAYIRRQSQTSPSTAPAEESAPVSPPPDTACANHPSARVSHSTKLADIPRLLTQLYLSQYLSPQAGSACRITGYQISYLSTLASIGGDTYTYQAILTLTTPAAPTTFWSSDSGTIDGQTVKNTKQFFQVDNTGQYFVVTAVSRTPIAP